MSLTEDFSAAESFAPEQPLQMEVRGKLFEGLEVALLMTVDGTNETAANSKLDLMRRMFERQRVVFEHRETMLMLANKRVTLKELPTLIADYTQKRLRERAAEEARWTVRWNRDKRGDFRMSAAQQQWMDQFSDETEKKLAEFKTMLDEYPGEIQNLEDRINRCKRVLAGLERTDLLLDLDPWGNKDAAE